MPLTATVTCLVLLEYMAFGMLVGRARMNTGIKAPAIGGNEQFERWFRVHQNTMEQLVVFLPSLWIFATFVHELTAAGLGLIFFVGRIIYCRSYVRDPATRGPGFMLSALPSMILLLGGLVGAFLHLF